MSRKNRNPWWIKERLNPQLGTYYVAEGQISCRDARKHETPIYGYNTMLRFDTEAEYLAKLTELRAAGERVQLGRDDLRLVWDYFHRVSAQRAKYGE